ncbi:hypothetical protein BOTBODRAFT_263838 [Botryobasidium botryosum FD-172 SS1]|uniref:Uncharacterized protein n=1 Tax=Botryobasidium botryosum (strain FD-172 SS1) TaxID=930990 RepID=A0A067LT07_BOTB1|nr:hypothetical protein BOTBODRAFT_263838 [Botryobasidium botryosum FD-172 SS1]
MFHRLFGGEEKTSQIRWSDFEKFISQLGFDVVEAEGSSVRFDPPVQNARPITFHRPHPDSTLTPMLIKWCVHDSNDVMVGRTRFSRRNWRAGKNHERQISFLAHGLMEIDA